MTRLFLIILTITSLNIFGQSEYGTTYRFLEVPTSAYSAAMGGSPIVSADSSINFISVNPALLTPSEDKQIGLNFITLAPGLNMGFLTWGYDMKDLGFLAAGVQFLNYGSIDRTDIWGNNLGTYTGGDYALMVSWTKPLLKYLNMGATFKGIYSKIESYNSSAVAFDAGLTYNNPNLKLTVSLVGKNIGNQIDPYVEGVEEGLPMDFQFGIAKGLAHAPFRFSVVAHHITSEDLLITNNNTVEPNNTELEPEELETDYINEKSENIMRHFIFGLEFIPSKKFRLHAGYNYYRRSTMKMIENSATIGFSFGGTILIKDYFIAYAYSPYHLAGKMHNISIRTNLGRFFN